MYELLLKNEVVDKAPLANLKQAKTFFMKRIKGCFFIQNIIKIMSANIIKKMFLIMNFYRINKLSLFQLGFAVTYKKIIKK